MEFNEFESIKIGLASSEIILNDSYGVVTKPETINYRTLKPERDGLFCEKIFGPQKDWECYCGKYKRIRYKGKICERCGVEITRAKVRRERMGHIQLAAPVSHIWYFKGTSSRLGLLLNMSPRLLERVLYFASYVVIDPGKTSLKKYTLLSEVEYRELKEAYEDDFKAGMGAEAVKELLDSLNLDEMAEELKEELQTAKGQKKAKTLKRLEVVEAFRQSGNKPSWMILDVVPVIPPELRPMVQLDGGRFATSDLNDLYRRVINRNNRLDRLMKLGAPDIIIRNEKRMLQESVDALIDNGRRGRPVTGPNNRPLKSLSDMLKGKQGRFRQNLLGKRVDYSGRSVIVVGPELMLYQCGLPKEMAIELFKPFVMKRLVDTEDAQNAKQAKKMVERANTKEVWDALEVVIKDHSVLLNRAPTLHRLGIQAFEPVLVEGKAIKLHPLVCTAYNADFDGDQMAVHVPLSAEAQSEARFLMLSANNLLKPSDGRPVAIPTQDMVLGIYYLTMKKEAKDKNNIPVFVSPEEAIMAYQEKIITLHEPVKIRIQKEILGQIRSKRIDTTVGRVLFNEPIPQDLGFVERTNSETEFDLEIDFLVRRKELAKIIERCIARHGSAKTAELLDKIKSLGFKYSTKGAITIAISDAVIPKEKPGYITEAESRVEEIQKRYERGLISDEVRYERVIKTWNDTTAKVKDALEGTLEVSNPIYMMADSGARGSMDQIRQLAGMRGLIANTSGRAIEVPIRANYREGLNVLEYFNSSRGARKGLADTALRTADSGYLTRRLVDVSQEVIIHELDCGATEGAEVLEFVDSGRVIEEFTERLQGRYPVNDVMNKETGELIASKNHMIDEMTALKIQQAGYLSLEIRSIFNCKAKTGICSKCYGANLANGLPVAIGEAVGVIAAQSIGEPGTQLTMRTFHTGGIASARDITQGLPRIGELFEARKPKMAAVISHLNGVANLTKDKRENDIVVVTSPDGDTYEKQIVYGSTLMIADGDHVKKGDLITEGSVEPAELLDVMGELAVQNYIIQEVQRVYRTQGVDINDKHVEIVVRQMMRQIRVDEEGDTKLISGSVTSKNEFLEACCEAVAKGGKPATFIPIIQGITRSSLATESFMSAAAFQETTRVLTEAAIQGKEDYLEGLKENVIIGKLIPAGTGTVTYNKFRKTAPDLPTNVYEDALTESEFIERFKDKIDSGIDITNSMDPFSMR